MSRLARQCGRLVLLVAVLGAVGRGEDAQPEAPAPVSIITPDVLQRLVEQAITSEIRPLVSKLVARIDAFDARLIGVDSRLNSLDARLLAVDAARDRFDSRLDELKPRVDELMSRVDGLVPRVDELAAQWNTQESWKDGLSSRLDNISKDLDGLTSRLDDQHSRLDEFANGTAGRQAESGEDRADASTQTAMSPLSGFCSHETALPRDCSDLPTGARSGVHLLQPGLDRSQPPVPAFCDLDTDGGGWTVIQRRADIQPRQDFYLDWAAYREGFGELDAEFWWGLRSLWTMTAPRDRRYELRVNLADFEGERRNATYGLFRVASEADGYRLLVANYTGDAGDSLSKHNGNKFSTRDRDQDRFNTTHCAQTFKAAWWYQNCYFANLNGQYLSGPHTAKEGGVNWNSWQMNYSLKETEMKIRPVDTI